MIWWDEYSGEFCRRRKNLLKFSEMARLNFVINIYIQLESTVFLLMYKVQDTIGPDYVFYTIHTIYAVFDLFFVVCVIALLVGALPS